MEKADTLGDGVSVFSTDFPKEIDCGSCIIRLLLEQSDIRMTKSKIKVSGCFRTEKGAQECLDIMSYASTAKKQGCSAFEAIGQAVAGTPDFIFSRCAE